MAHRKISREIPVRKTVKALTIPLFVALLIIMSSCSTEVPIMTRSGESQLMSGNYQEAINTYTRAIDLAPKDAEAYLGRATAYEKLGFFDRALADFDKAVALLPKDSGVYVNRGLAYEMSGNYQMALRDYTAALELDPGNATAYFNCGNVAVKLGDPAQAVEYYKMAARKGSGEAQNILKSKGMGW